MSILVDLQIATDTPALPSEKQLTEWASLAANDRIEGGEITIRLVDKDESQTLNRTYRNNDKPTNVLSFPFEAPEGVDIDLLGDLVICAQVVAEEAVQQHKQPLDHWAHLVIHGMLHLLGYDHIQDDEAQAMETLETLLLAQLGIGDPYQENT